MKKEAPFTRTQLLAFYGWSFDRNKIKKEKAYKNFGEFLGNLAIKVIERASLLDIDFLDKELAPFSKNKEFFIREKFTKKPRKECKYIFPSF